MAELGGGYQKRGSVFIETQWQSLSQFAFEDFNYGSKYASKMVIVMRCCP
jgi:hypothetical protein